MDSLYIKATEVTPEINFDSSSGIMNIIGKSLLNGDTEFSQPVFKWVENYLKRPKDLTVVNINLEYFDDTSSKMLLELFMKLEKLVSNKRQLKINWLYSVDNMANREAGEIIGDMLNTPFTFHALT